VIPAGVVASDSAHAACGCRISRLLDEI